MIIEYKPTWVKLPVGLKREFIIRINNQNKLIPKAEVPNYDDYSLFYDVFFSLDKKYIWTVGPQLLSVKEKLFPIKILYKGMPLEYEYCDYAGASPTSSSSCFKIPATSIKEKNPTLTFRGKDWKIDIKVNSFPSINNNEYELVLSTLQKNYATSHVIDWILWHHRLHHFERFLFYDNGSDNVIEVKTALQNLNIPNLKIVFIDWSYYYGGVNSGYDLHSGHDLLAQNTQLNHTLRLHSDQKYFIAIWDLDEFLINTNSMTLQHSMKKKPYQIFERYDVVDIAKEPLSSIAECRVIKKKPCICGKYLYRSDIVEYLCNPHSILGRRFMHRVLFVFIKVFGNRCSNIFFSILHQIIRKNFIRHSRFMHRLLFAFTNALRDKRIGIINQDFYLVHTQPIKVVWKKHDFDKGERPFKEVFDPRIHVKDDNIQKNLKKAKLRCSS